jgi:hypothetical protein
MKAGRIDGAATAIHHQGRTQQLWQVNIIGEASRLVVTGHVRLKGVEPRQ